MSRKAAKKSKPTPRGRQGGRKPKYDVPMISKSLRMPEDTWAMIIDSAAAEKISQGEWVMKKLSETT